MDTRTRAEEALKRLKKEYPERGPFVEWKNSLELVVGTMLSAQCTDVRVNMVTKTLFKKYKTAKDYARADLCTLEKEIYSTGFFKSKAKYLKGIGERIVKDFGGRVPATLEDLLTLPGLSHKSAHLVMAKAFGKFTGIAVDTHVYRVAPRLGLTQSKDRDKVAGDLEKLYPPKEYLNVNEYCIMHGRAICKPRPLCGECVLQDICPSADI
ncbi:MAG: endonuclease III [Patescibacteria group bacterium]